MCLIEACLRFSSLTALTALYSVEASVSERVASLLWWMYNRRIAAKKQRQKKKKVAVSMFYNDRSSMVGSNLATK